MAKKFYVYELHTIPDGAVCYVGKGSRYRMYSHKRNALRGAPSGSHVSFLYRSLRKLIDSGGDFYPVKVFETDIEEEAWSEETRRILAYGVERLFNISTVRGTSPTDYTAASREAMRRARNERVAENLRLHGHKMDPATAAKIGAAHKGRIRPDLSDHLRQEWASGKRKPHPKGFRKGIPTGIPCPQHVKTLNSKRQTGVPLDPEHVAKIAASRRANLKPKGVIRFKNRWQARICVGHKIHHLGYWLTEYDARAVYDNEHERLFGTRPNGTQYREVPSAKGAPPIRLKNIRKFIKVPCLQCGMPVTRSAAEVSRAVKRGVGVFCAKGCASKWSRARHRCLLLSASLPDTCEITLNPIYWR